MFVFLYFWAVSYIVVIANPILQKTVRNLTSPQLFVSILAYSAKPFCASRGLDITNALALENTGVTGRRGSIPTFASP